MNTTNEEQAIRDLYAAWRQATLSEDIDALLQLIADDAVFLVPGQPPIRGKQQFAEVFEVARGKFRIEARSEFDEIVVHGDRAQVLSRLAVAMTPKIGGQPILRSGHTLTILQKQPSGWVVARDANMLAPETREDTAGQQPRME